VWVCASEIGSIAVIVFSGIEPISIFIDLSIWASVNDSAKGYLICFQIPDLYVGADWPTAMRNAHIPRGHRTIVEEGRGPSAISIPCVPELGGHAGLFLQGGQSAPGGLSKCHSKRHYRFKYL